MPNINVKLSAPFVIFAALVVFSYFTHVGWWAWSGLALIIAAVFAQENKYEALGYLFIILCLILFILGIVSTGWDYSIFN